MSTQHGETRDRAHPTHHRLVVGVDGSEGSQTALEWAAAEAGRTGAVIEIHAAYSPGYAFLTPSDVQRVLQEMIENATSHISSIAPDLMTKGIAHEGPPGAALVDASYGANLLIVGSRGLGGFAGLLLGSVSQQCVLHAHCPVLVVRPAEERPDREGHE
jgi:nucleotide-binding universal stress UspA family protein